MHRLRAAETGDIEAMTDLLLSHGPNPWNHLPEEGVRAHLRAIADGEVRAVLAERDDRLLGSPASAAPRISPITSRSVPMRRGPTSARR